MITLSKSSNTLALGWWIVHMTVRPPWARAFIRDTTWKQDELSSPLQREKQRNDSQHLPVSGVMSQQKQTWSSCGALWSYVMYQFPSPISLPKNDYLSIIPIQSVTFDVTWKQTDEFREWGLHQDSTFHSNINRGKYNVFFIIILYYIILGYYS